MCSIGKTAIPFRISKNRMVQSLLHMRTYLEHKQKLTTGEPIYVSHLGLFETKPSTLHMGPLDVFV